MLGIIKKKESAMEKTQERPAVPAAVDVFENEKEFLLVADLPGIGQDGADVKLEHDRLFVNASAPGRRYSRELVVPPSVDAENVTAQMKGGVLTVHLPKRPRYQPRQIHVKAS